MRRHGTTRYLPVIHVSHALSQGHSKLHCDGLVRQPIRVRMKSSEHIHEGLIELCLKIIQWDVIRYVLEWILKLTSNLVQACKAHDREEIQRRTHGRLVYKCQH